MDLFNIKQFILENGYFNNKDYTIDLNINISKDINFEIYNFLKKYYSNYEKIELDRYTLVLIYLMAKMSDFDSRFNGYNVTFKIIEIKERETMNIITPKEAHELAVEKGFYDWTTQREIPELLCLIHAEISEALEGFRKNIPPGEKGCVGEELADAVIRIWDMAYYLKIDIAEEVNKKHEYNKTRPYRHGNKKC